MEQYDAKGFVSCPACYRRYKSIEGLKEHVSKAGHFDHEPVCGCCGKHSKCLEAHREHVIGRLAKKGCAQQFSLRGCELCFAFFEDAAERDAHAKECYKMAIAAPGPHHSAAVVREEEVSLCQQQLSKLVVGQQTPPAVVALDCEMVGGGESGEENIAARICMVDESDNVLLSEYIRPSVPVVDYRTEFTGIKEGDLANGIPLVEARRRVLDILHNKNDKYASLVGGKPLSLSGQSQCSQPLSSSSSSSSQPSSSLGHGDNAGAVLLVGHGLDHDLKCLGIHYPAEFIRDTANYPPLLKTSGAPHKLKFLTATFLGYNIQVGAHDPKEDAIAAMRLYRRFRYNPPAHKDSSLHVATSQPRITSVIASPLLERRNSVVTRSSPLATPPSKRQSSPLAHSPGLLPSPRSNTAAYHCWCIDSN